MDSRPEIPPTVTVVGAGGLGTPAALSILDAWPTGHPLRLNLVDGDTVQRSNLNRQILFGEHDLGRNKAEVLSARLLSRRSDLEIVALAHYLDTTNAEGLIAGSDYVLECSDSVECKFNVNDTCCRLGVPFCYAGVIGLRGLLLETHPGKTPCLRCIFGDLSPEDIREQGVSCQTAGILGPIAGMFGALQGERFIRFAALREPVPRTLLRFDGAEFRSASAHIDLRCPCRFSLQTLDLRSKVCPETFLYTKLALESLGSSVALRVIYQSEAIAEKVRRSCIEHGYQVSEPAPHGGSWTLALQAPEKNGARS